STPSPGMKDRLRPQPACRADPPGRCCCHTGAMSTAVVALVCALCAGVVAWRLGRVLQQLTGRPAWLRYHPQVPLAAAGAAAGALWAASSAETVLLTGAATGLALLVVADLAVHRLPDPLILGTGAWVLLCLLAMAAAGEDWPALGRAVLAGGALGAAFLLLCLLTPGGLGLGDVKLAALVGGLLGWFGWCYVLFGVLAAFLLGGLVAAGLILARRAGRHTAVAFGPWLIAGAAAALAWSPALLP